MDAGLGAQAMMATLLRLRLSVLVCISGTADLGGVTRLAELCAEVHRLAVFFQGVAVSGFIRIFQLYIG